MLSKQYDDIGYRMCRMLPFLYSDTKTGTVQYIAFMHTGSVCTSKQIYLQGLQQAKRQACGCEWWAAGLKGH